MNTFERAGRAMLCAVMATSAAACATVTRGVNQAWTVQSTPPGAAVKTNIGFACDETPCTFKMPRKSTFEVTVSKPGYKTYHGNVVHQVSGGGGAGMAGNVLVGGLIGAGVDVASGAMMDLKPNPLVVTLEAEAAEPAAPTATPVTPAAAETAPAAEAPAPAAATAAAPAAAPATASTAPTTAAPM